MRFLYTYWNQEYDLKYIKWNERLKANENFMHNRPTASSGLTDNSIIDQTGQIEDYL